MGNYSLIMMVIVMLSINIGLGLYDSAITSYNPDFDSIINFNSSPASAYLSDKSLSGGLNTDVSLALPDTADSVDVESGNIFTDTWKSVKNWFGSFGIISDVLDQPRGFLVSIGVPLIYANSFGLLWYVMIVFLTVSALRGGGVS